jgi:hypothetical protein
MATSQQIPLEGTLGDVLFPELLVFLYQIRASGSLNLRFYGEDRTIYFSDGVPQFIHSNFIQEESIGQLLVRQNLITPDRLRQLLQKAKDESKLIGEVLISSQVLTRGELDHLLKRQARFKLVNVFKLKEGSYAFTSGPPQFNIPIRLESDILRILVAGVTRHLTLSVLENKIFNNRDRVVMRKRIERVGPNELGLTRSQWALIGLADSERSLGDIIADSSLNFKQTFQTIYLFFLYGIFYFADGKSGVFHIDEPVLARAISESRNMGQASVGEMEDPTEIPPSGDLADTPLTLLLFRMWYYQETGILLLKLEKSAEKLIMMQGRPVKIETVGSGDLVLGEILVQKGLLKQEDRDRMLAMSKDAGRPLGEILINNQLVSPHQIFEMLKLQIEMKINFLFGLTQGNYTYERLDPSELSHEMTFDIDIAKLAVQAMKQTLDPESLENDLLKYKAFILERTAIGKMKLDHLFTDPREVQLINLVNSRRSLAQIVDRSPLRTNQAMSALTILLKLGIVRFIQE